MRSFNKVMILGNMTADPKAIATKNGNDMTSFSVATNRDWKDTEGKMVTETHFHKVVAFGRLAGTISTYFKKGSPILLSGRLSTRSYATQEGKIRYTTEVVAEDFNFVPTKKVVSAKNQVSAQELADKKADALDTAEAELADELAEKYAFRGAELEEAVDY